ncbi:MAG: hypothetical protein MI757_18440 [Pirellulales bacterium]|nr:hypothetical protein [Pirellulales bacterium]
MIEKVVGTIALDGLIEGRGVEGPEVAEKVRGWVTDLTKLGPKMELSIAGDSFSLLPDNRPVPMSRMGDDPHQALAEMLNHLQQILPTEQRRHTSSTLRSVHFHSGVEVQTLYLVGTDSEFRVESRTLEATTIEPPEPPSVKERVQLGFIGLLAALALLGIISIFVDLRGLVGEVFSSVTPVSAEEIDIDSTAFDKYFSIEDKTVSNRHGHIALTLKRTEAFPLESTALESEFEAAKSLHDRLALKAIAKQYLRLELYNENNELIRQQMVHIKKLVDAETMKLQIPLRVGSRNIRVARIRLTI